MSNIERLLYELTKISKFEEAVLENNISNHQSTSRYTIRSEFAAEHLYGLYAQLRQAVKQTSIVDYKNYKVAANSYSPYKITEVSLAGDFIEHIDEETAGEILTALQRFSMIESCLKFPLEEFRVLCGNPKAAYTAITENGVERDVIVVEISRDTKLIDTLSYFSKKLNHFLGNDFFSQTYIPITKDDSRTLVRIDPLNVTKLAGLTASEKKSLAHAFTYPREFVYQQREREGNGIVDRVRTIIEKGARRFEHTAHRAHLNASKEARGMV